jgi:hypothetical protein
MPICGGSAPNSWSVGARITRAASFRPSLPWSTGISSRSPRAGSSNGVPRPRVGRSLSRRGARSGFVLRRSLRATAGVRSALGAGGGSGGHEGRASQDRLAGHDGCATRCAQGLAVCRRGTTCANARLLSVNPRLRDTAAGVQKPFAKVSKIPLLILCTTNPLATTLWTLRRLRRLSDVLGIWHSQYEDCLYPCEEGDDDERPNYPECALGAYYQ